MAVIIPLQTFGGDGTLIHFAHGNGYAPGCYIPFVSEITSHTRVIGMKSRPLWDESEIAKMEGWRQLSGDLEAFYNTRNLRQIVGMGHSMGAVLTSFTSLSNPDYYKATILIEPSLLMPSQLAMFRMMPKSMLKTQPLFKDSLNRPTSWESMEAAADYVNTSPKYANWTPEARQSYIEHGFHKVGREIKLVFGSDWETLIYRQTPRAWASLAQIEVPTLAIRGADSDIMTDKAWERWQKTQPDATFVEISGAGHSVTMEKPAEVGEAIIQFLDNNNLL